MISTDSEVLDAIKLFNIGVPFTIGALKKRYRKLAFDCHPDRGGDEDTFKKISSAYTVLQSCEGNQAGIFSDQTETIVIRGSNGKPLSEHGLGLGPTTNGRICTSCDGEGYTEWFKEDVVDCTRCDKYGVIVHEEPCKACNGTGGRLLPCAKCKGTKIHVNPYSKSTCPICKGLKFNFETRKVPQYQTCWDCKGTGEIPIWNAVVPKGSISV